MDLRGAACAGVVLACVLASAAAGVRAEAEAGAVAAVLSHSFPAPTADLADRFGEAVTVDGLRMAVGAPRDDVAAVNAGAVHVYRADSRGWVLEATLRAADPLAGANFGHSVALAGNTLVVGAPGDGTQPTSAVYVFTRSGTTWTQETRRTAPGLCATPETFGWSVAAAAGAFVAGGIGDCAVGFLQQGTTWTATALPYPDQDGGAVDWFGSSVAIAEVTAGVYNAVVGAPVATRAGLAGAGAAYVFVGDVFSDWFFEQRLEPADRVAGSAYGQVVAVHGSTIAVGRPNTSPDGAVYVHTQVGGGAWTQRAKLAASEVPGADRFGSAVAVRGGEVIAAAEGVDVPGTGRGRAFLFQGGGSAWAEAAVLRPPGNASGVFFGDAVALDDGALLVAAPAKGAPPGTVGAVHRYGPDGDSDRLIDRDEQRLYGTSPTKVDTEGDRLGDGAEILDHRTDPLDVDTDDDRLGDGAEFFDHLTEPLLWDTEGDRLGDGEEVLDHFTDPLDLDTEDDTLDDGAEVLDHFTDPLDPDTDDDLLLDGREVHVHRTLPLDPDTDDDELGDGLEVLVHRTDPLDPDTDDDLLLDGHEVALGTKPLVGDTDRDWLLDGVERHLLGLDPRIPDMDGDGLLDGREFLLEATDPRRADSDLDGLGDGAEVLQHGTDPLVRDTDGDLYGDGTEVGCGTDPADSGAIPFPKCALPDEVPAPPGVDPRPMRRGGA